MLNSFLAAVLLGSFSLAAFAHGEDPVLPPANMRREMLTRLASEMMRVDGEGLIVRAGRPSSFPELVERLAAEAERAQSWPAFSLALKRLDMAYPNLHSYLELSDEIPNLKRVLPAVGFVGEWLAPGITRFRISRVDAVSFPEGSVPQIGDELVAINGRSMDQWKREHFDFCKMPMREQCALWFPGDFHNEVSGWTREQGLVYTLRRDGHFWNLPVSLKTKERTPRDDSHLLCANYPDRYPGFRLVHKGQLACFYASEKDPSTLLLRITSFQYNRSTNQGMKTLQEEVDALWPFWSERAPGTSHLILDVIDNHGGNQNTPYYEVFFDRPHQEQRTRFRKIRELEDPALRDTFFWGTPEQELWFQNIKKEGLWDSVAFGDFLPSLPMFCARKNEDCRIGLFPVKNHGFRGRVTMLVNQECISSCDAFVFTFKQELGDRVRIVGQPQAADTAYSRLRLGVELDAKAPGGFSIKSLPQYGDVPKNILFSQVASISRSVTEDGTVVSGRPLPVDIFVPLTLENEGMWHRAALEAAIAQ